MKRFISSAMAFVMFAVCSAQAATPPEHVMPLTELQGQLRTATESRAKNLEDIERVLSYPAATAALAKSNVNPEQMRAAVATLNDAELARLSDRARASEKDVEGGLLVGILALIGLIVVIIIVVSLVASAHDGSVEDATAVA